MSGRALLVLLAAMCVLACTDDPERFHRPRAQTAVLQQAVAKGDAAKIASVYLEDAQVIPPDTGEPLKGHAAIRALWQRRLDDGLRAIEYTRKTYRGEGDRRYEMGTYTARDTEGEIDVGRYFTIWDEVDGIWFVSRHTWASDIENQAALGEAMEAAEADPNAPAAAAAPAEPTPGVAAE